MSGEMRPQPFDRLLERMLIELRSRDEIFGLDRSLFYVPQGDEPYGQTLFGRRLATPFGPAAGPHTQLAQNIVSAWLCGGRFIELKTVQIMDELDISRPCIDMEDEGYNVEWSQELKLDASAREYINAWALLHLLPRILQFPQEDPRTIFNMSVGYDLEGVRSAPVVRFMDQLENASEELDEIRESLLRIAPRLADTEIPSRVTNNVTISTMHGCPPEQIEGIGRYLLEERGLHTMVKLNPTLLGQEEVMRILHRELGYREINIPENVFTHDLQYEQALELIESLKDSARQRGLFFGVKLSNTLPTANHKGYLPGDELFMSGRALYPITLNLYHRLVEAFDGELEVSYAAGADAHNAATVLASGARTVTAASDLLKPGGYGRLHQWLDELSQQMRQQGAGSLEEFAHHGRERLAKAASESRQDPRYRREHYSGVLPKVETDLEEFDCIVAPCVEQCAILQDVPEYAWWITRGDFDNALEAILHRNPLPGVTGYICNHLCQSRCTRIGYDQPVLIRALKRFAADKSQGSLPRPAPEANKRVAVVGGGPAGLAAAYFLALSGVRVTVFERRTTPGGWPAVAPGFRLPQSVIQQDVERIRALGVEFRLGREISAPPEDLLAQGHDAVYLACGFQRDASPGIEGEGAQGVWGALELLERVAQGEQPDLGGRVCVVGGGNTAMDAARTAQRLTGRPVTVVYRRTEAEMPADQEELDDFFAEGNRLLPLLSPVRVAVEDGRAVGLECVRNELGGPGSDGRRKPVPVPGTEQRLPADAVIFAVGQTPEVSFLNGGTLRFEANGRLKADPTSGKAGENVYAGGDLSRGPATIVEACGDGRDVAEAICRSWAIPFHAPPAPRPELHNEHVLEIKRARTRKEPPHRPHRLQPEQRSGFQLVEQTLSDESARHEAARCLQCSTLCDKCVEVCPNRANVVYFITSLQAEAPVL
ncbi:MAG: putative selenate reductase subunit YgfK, partial [Candidatus Bipolaricaulota bacterium]